ncbi:septum formation family protein [Arthrobacter sp. HS15c]|uniref:septum formation family protein n=1 Tax=Arthrobacter sp. HS15c TaxID=3230279 RepID=UPI0034669B7F
MNQEDTATGPSGGDRDFAAGRTERPPKPAAPPTAGLPLVPPAAPPRVELPGLPPAPPSRNPRRTGQIVLKTVFVLVLAGVVGSLVWLALWLSDNAQNSGNSGADGSGIIEISPTAPASALPLPREGVAPADFKLGDCFKDFDPEALKSTVVACDAGHSAQLVATYRYPATDSYPGGEALKAKALEACQAAKLAPPANDFTLNFQRAYPSSTSWESGDRRVDCYVTAPGGNVITASVLPAIP